MMFRTTVNVSIREFWFIRGIKDTGNKKEVVHEKFMSEEPTKDDIAQFLYDHPSVTFVSVEHNFCKAR